MKKSPPPLGQESKLESLEISNTQAVLIFMGAYKFLIYQA